MGKCGQPKGAPAGVPAPLAYRREYEGCTAVLNCSSTTGENARDEDTECRAWVEGL